MLNPQNFKENPVFLFRRPLNIHSREAPPQQASNPPTPPLVIMPKTGENVRAWLTCIRTVHDNLAARYDNDSVQVSEILSYLQWYEDFVRASSERLLAPSTSPTPTRSTAAAPPRKGHASKRAASRGRTPRPPPGTLARGDSLSGTRQSSQPIPG